MSRVFSRVRRRLSSIKDRLTSRWRLRSPSSIFEEVEEVIHPVPALPDARPTVLTPSSSREDLRLSAAAATAASRFFQKLPGEIRRRILIEAFGGHTVHMDLWYFHPQLPVPERWVTRDAPDAGLDNNAEGLGPSRVVSHCNRFVTDMPYVDYTVPQRWIWSSSECHRLPPPHHESRLGRALDQDYWNVAEDSCRTGCKILLRKTCTMWCGDDPSKCFIGAMGWLQSCRQAYCEGLEVLYGTNTIHTASQQMLLNMDKVLLPQRLESIRSMEIVWELAAFPKPLTHLGSFTDLESYNKLLRILPDMFPNLRSLTFCLQGHLVPFILLDDDWDEPAPRPPEETHKLIEDTIMSPLDSMVRRLPENIRNLSVAVSSGLYSQMRHRAKTTKGKGPVEQVQYGAPVERHWRDLGEEAATMRTGYWIQLGRRDRPWPWDYGGHEYEHEFYPEDDDVFYKRAGRP